MVGGGGGGGGGDGGGGAPAVPPTLDVASFRPRGALWADDLTTVRKLGGAAMVRQLAVMTPLPVFLGPPDESAMTDLDGPGGVAVAKGALADLEAIAAAGVMVDGAPFAGWPGAPADWSEATCRLHELLRHVGRSKWSTGYGGGSGASGGGGGGGGGGGSHKPPPGSSLAVPSVDMSKHADKALRAAAAHVLAPIATNEVVWQARTGAVILDDPIQEARRVIDERQACDPAQGAAARASMGSNGMVVGQLAGDCHPSPRPSCIPRASARRCGRRPLGACIGMVEAHRHGGGPWLVRVAKARNSVRLPL